MSTSEKQISELEAMPYEILRRIGDYLGYESAYSLSRANQNLSGLFFQGVLWDLNRVEDLLRQRYPLFPLPENSSKEALLSQYKLAESSCLQLRDEARPLFSLCRQNDFSEQALKATGFEMEKDFFRAFRQNAFECDSEGHYLFQLVAPEHQSLLDKIYQLALEESFYPKRLRRPKGPQGEDRGDQREYIPSSRGRLSGCYDIGEVHWAIACRQPKSVVQYCISRVRSMDNDCHGLSPLSTAVLNNDSETVYFLLEQAVARRERLCLAKPLIKSIEIKNSGLLECLLGRWNEEKPITETTFRFGHTLLYFAIEQRWLEGVEILAQHHFNFKTVKWGYDERSRDLEYSIPLKSALELAVEKNWLQGCEYCLAKGGSGIKVQPLIDRIDRETSVLVSSDDENYDSDSYDDDSCDDEGYDDYSYDDEGVKAKIRDLLSEYLNAEPHYRP